MRVRRRHHRPGTPEGGRRKGGCRQGIGRPGGGLTGRIVAIADAPGCLVRFVILPGQVHDLAGVPEPMEDFSFGTLIGDRASGARRLIEEIEESGAMAVIPPRRRRTYPREMHGVAAPDRERLLKDQGVPRHRHPRGQDRRRFRRGDSSRQWRGRGNMIVDRPWSASVANPSTRNGHGA